MSTTRYHRYHSSSRILTRGKHSIKAMQWIKYISITEGIRIQHARNGGEKEIGPYKVDGYYENENVQQCVLEFNGKFWHRCLHCYNASTVNPVNGMTMRDLYQRTMEKNRYPTKLCPTIRDGQPVRTPRCFPWRTHRSVYIVSKRPGYIIRRCNLPVSIYQ
jgi:hypothetical protein